MLLAKMLKVLDNLLVSEKQEPITCVLVSLSIELLSNDTLHRIHLFYIMFLFIDFDATAPAAYTMLFPLLSPDRARFFVFDLNVGQFVNELLQFNALLVQVVVFTDDSSTHEH